MPGGDTLALLEELYGSAEPGDRLAVLSLDRHGIDDGPNQAFLISAAHSA
jgi:hypothetical protein